MIPSPVLIGRMIESGANLCRININNKLLAPVPIIEGRTMELPPISIIPPPEVHGMMCVVPMLVEWNVLRTTKLKVYGEAMNKVSAAIYSGVSSTGKQILKEEGWVGLTRGMGPRVLHSACFSAIGYFAFETARLAILNQYLKKKESPEIYVAPA